MFRLQSVKKKKIALRNAPESGQLRTWDQSSVPGDPQTFLLFLHRPTAGYGMLRREILGMASVQSVAVKIEGIELKTVGLSAVECPPKGFRSEGGSHSVSPEGGAGVQPAVSVS